jgi:PAS domain S-box-containing protein
LKEKDSIKDIEGVSREELALEVARLRGKLEALESGEASLVSAKDPSRILDLFRDHSAVMYVVEPVTLRLVDLNLSAEKFYGYPREKFLRMRIPDLNPLPEDFIKREIDTAQGEGRDCYYFVHRLATGETRSVEIRSTLVTLPQGSFFIAIVNDITERKIIELERQRALDELRGAMENVRTLEGLLLICASCQKIRDDKGYWTAVDSYLTKHTRVEFTHGICPDCVKEIYLDKDYKSPADRG